MPADATDPGAVPTGAPPRPDADGAEHAGRETPPAPHAPARLGNAVAREVRELLADRPAVLCVGNEQRGDDAVGAVIGQRLRGACPWPVFCAETAPENFVVKIADARPRTLLVIDCADFGGRPGEARLLAPAAVRRAGPSTHGPGISAMLGMLRMVHPCPVVILAVQPADVRFGSPMSSPVAAAACAVAELIRSAAQ